MFKEILQVIPKMSSSDLNNMERSLSRRFQSIAKKFGKGLAASLTGGGIAGLALGLIDKLLNPLKETQEAIDRVLKQGDDIVTNAKQFGTTAGRLFRLQQLAASTGLEAGDLNTLLAKFQTAVAEAVADPEKQTSVRLFATPQFKEDPNDPTKQVKVERDTAADFFTFIQSLQKMEKNQQVLVQQEVFGEKQILKMADFLQTDFDWQQKLLGGPNSEDLDAPLQKLGGLNDFKDVLAANRELNDVVKKSREINANMVRSQDEQLRTALDRENQQIQSYQNLAAISEASNKILNVISKGGLDLAGMLLRVTDLTSNVRKLTESRAVKGLMKVIGGDK